MNDHTDYDAVLVLSFGGPDNVDDVMPFLQNVVRGRNVPAERLGVVAEHYLSLGGRSPINDQCRALIEALRAELETHDIELPIYWGNRNWHPLLTDTLRRMRADGVKRALAYVTSAFSSYSGCRQYIEDIEAARTELGEGAPVIDKLRGFYNHPGFIDASAARVAAGLAELPKHDRPSTHIVFTAHSIPVAMAEACDYAAQLHEACSLVANEIGHPDWSLSYQSRSGPPQVPWLGPDILEHLRELAAAGHSKVLVSPIGFLSDHVEVIWDLDEEAKALAAELGMKMLRVSTPGTHPSFVAMIRELIEERLGRAVTRRTLGTRGPRPNTCPPDCCAYRPRRAERAG
jgi:ferrochelatase